ncbi:MAG: hypothetical protein LBJ19_00095, partial [Holosporaceae bacterium]|nr:hypothetical protein [Holosporaceae bacterium]
ANKTCSSGKSLLLQPALLRFGAAVFLVPLLLIATIPSEDTTNDQPQSRKNAVYETKELFRAIDNISATPVVIMAHCNFGPQLLYYTKHKIVGAPYHRQQHGIIASHEVMEAAFSSQKIKKILAITGASYVFIKKPQTKQTKNGQINGVKALSLTEMIIAGQLPPWISIENFPKKFDDVVIAKIHRDLLTKK